MTNLSNYPNIFNNYSKNYRIYKYIFYSDYWSISESSSRDEILFNTIATYHYNNIL